MNQTPSGWPVPASKVERVCVELRIYSGELDPAEVTMRLGLPASKSVRRGDSITNSLGRTRVHAKNGWFLASENVVASSRPEEHLAWLVGVLSPASHALAALLACPGVSAMIVCTIWTCTSGASVPIASATVRALGALGVDVHVTFSSYEDEVLS